MRHRRFLRSALIRRSSARYLPHCEHLEDRIYPGDALWGYVSLQQLLRNRRDADVDPFASQVALTQAGRGGHLRADAEVPLLDERANTWRAFINPVAHVREALGFFSHATAVVAAQPAVATSTSMPPLHGPSYAAQEFFGDVLPTTEDLFDAVGTRRTRANGVRPGDGLEGTAQKTGGPGEGVSFFPPGSAGTQADSPSLFPFDTAVRIDDLFLAVNAGFGEAASVQGQSESKRSSTSASKPSGGGPNGPGADSHEGIETYEFAAVPCNGLGADDWVQQEFGGTVGGRGTVTADQCDFWMQEGDSYVVTLKRTFRLRAPFISFHYSNFASQLLTGRMNDAFEVALVTKDDPNDPTAGGRPLTHTIASGRDAFFNLTEGQAPKSATNVSHSNQHVSLDVSNLCQDTCHIVTDVPEVTLVFRLINNDGDTGTSIRVFGGHPDLVYRVPGNVNGPNPTLRFDMTHEETGYLLNTLWVYVVQDRDGRLPNGLLPGQAGYAAAVQNLPEPAQRRLIFAGSDTAGSWKQLSGAESWTPGTLLAAYLVREGGSPVFISYPAANPENPPFDHFQKTYHKDGWVQLAVEDLLSPFTPPEPDFNDMIFKVTATLPAGQPGGGSSPGAGPGGGVTGLFSNGSGITPPKGVPFDKTNVLPLGTGGNPPLLIPNGGQGGESATLSPNTGTDFWLAFPTGGAQNLDGSGALRLFVTGEFYTSVNVTIADPIWSQSHYLEPGRVLTINVPKESQLPGGSGSGIARWQKGIRVTAEKPITVYGLNYSATSSDAYLGLPILALGSEYVIPSYPKALDLLGATPGSELVVLAPSQVSNGQVNYPPGHVPASRNFSEMSAGLAEHEWKGTGAGDLTGTRVTASNPVAVFSGAGAIRIPENGGLFSARSRHLVEQIPPSRSLGRNFVVLPLATRWNQEANSGGDIIRVIAAQDATDVTVNGATFTLNRGQHHEAAPVTHGESTHITATKPVLVAQYSRNSEDCLFECYQAREDKHGAEFMTVVPPTEQFHHNYRVATAGTDFDINFLNVVAPTSALGTIRLNGNVLPANSFVPIRQSGYSGTRVRVTPGPHHLTGDLPFGVLVYGYQSVYDPNTDPLRGYGYPGGMSVAPIADATGISLSPDGASLTLGVQSHHRVTATVSPSLENVRVDFRVSGAHTVLGFAYTNAAGQAGFVYPGTQAGTDTIVASIGAEPNWRPSQVTAFWSGSVTTPTIQVLSPSNSSTFGPDTSVLVSGIARSGQARYPITHVTVNSAPVEALDAAGNFFTRVVVGPGSNEYRFVATDLIGQTAATTITLRGDAPSVDFNQLADVTASAGAEYERTSLNEKADALYADLKVRNVGRYAIGTPLFVGIRNIRFSSPPAPLPDDQLPYPRDTDGRLPDGTPYYDLSSLVSAGILTPPQGQQPGQVSGVKSLAFHNPARKRFTYDLVVMAGLNRAPRFTSVPRVEAIVGQTYTYQAVASDPDSHTLTWVTDANQMPPEGPSGLVMSPSGLVTWAAPTAGTHTVRLQVRDAFGGSAEQSFTITVSVAPPNRPPQFTSLPVLTGRVNTPYSYQATALDLDGPTVRFAVGQPSPAGLTIHQDTGVVTWTPSGAQSGPQTITLTASDDSNPPATATQTFVVIVQPDPSNQPPVILSPNTATARHSQPFKFTVWATDPDPNDTLMFSLIGAPQGLSIGAVSGLLSWANVPLPAVDWTFTVHASDNRGGVDSQEFRLQVRGVLTGVSCISVEWICGTVYNDLNGNGTQDGEPGLPGRTVYLDLNWNHRLDLDAGQPSEPSVLTGANGAYEFSGLSAGQYRVAVELPSGWFQTQPLAGAYAVTLPQSGIAGAPHPFGLTPTDLVNQPPVFQGTPPDSVRVGELYRYAPVVHDPDRDALTFNLAGRPAGMVIDRVSGTIGWRPMAAQVGRHPVTVVVRDGRGAEVRLPYEITVTQPNLPPVITSQPPTPARVGVPYTYLVHAVDPEGSRDLSFTPAADTGTSTGPNGPQTLTDNGKNWVSMQWQGGTVVAAGQRRTILSNTSTQLTVSPNWDSPLGDTTPYTIESVPQPSPTCTVNCPRMTLLPDDLSTPGRFARLTWTPSASQRGTVVFLTVTASDSGGAVGRQVISIPVLAQEPNRPPQFTSTPRVRVPAGRLYTYAPTASDPDGNELTFSLAPGHDIRLSIRNGVLQWQTAPGDVGQEVRGVDFTLRVSDCPNPLDCPSGTVAHAPFTITVDPPSTNQPPQIISVPPRAAVIGREYVYEARATDPELDAITWDLETAPHGVRLDPMRGTLRWLPTALQVGTHNVAVRATDGLGGRAVQRFTIHVRPVNQPPQVVSTPVVQANTATVYLYPVRAVDPEGDRLTYSLVPAVPYGMTIEPHTGLVRWHCPLEGTHTVIVQTEDSLGGVAQQTYRLVVVESQPNRPPVITSQPITTARVTTPATPYQYQVAARDPDISQTLQYSVVADPPAAGLTIDANGLLQWPTPVAREGTPPPPYRIAVTVNDQNGGTSQQRYDLYVRPNADPVFIEVPPTPQSVTGGLLYRYDVRARDDDGDALTYTLNENRPAGMSIDQYGRITWRTSVVAQNTDHAIQVTVTDPFGGMVSSSFTLRLLPDGEAPRVQVSWSPRTPDANQPVTFMVTAQDNVALARLRLSVSDGANLIEVPLDARGIGTLSSGRPYSVTPYPVEVTAIDTALPPGPNQTTVNDSLTVIDPALGVRPVINVCHPFLPGCQPWTDDADVDVSAPVSLTGPAAPAPAISTPQGQLTRYEVTVLSLTEERLTTIKSVVYDPPRQEPVVGEVAVLDPTQFPNGSYLLTVSASNTLGRTTRFERTVAITGHLKLGNFRLSFTDMTVPVAGIPITISRTYDTLQSDTRKDLGYGWRLDIGDADLKFHFPNGQYQSFGRFPALRYDDQVVLTRPGGEPERFFFRPIQVQSWPIPRYQPWFVPDAGVTSFLTVRPALLELRNDFGGVYISLEDEGIVSYNPAERAFGGTYTLVGLDGVQHILSAETGKLQKLTDRNRNELTVSATGVTSNRGNLAVQFERDGQGRITKVIDPRGLTNPPEPGRHFVEYVYNAAGDLVEFKDRLGQSTRYAYEPQKPHYLKDITDPLGRKPVTTAYNIPGDGRLASLTDAENKVTQVQYTVTAGVREQRIIPPGTVPADERTTTLKFDPRGNVTETRVAYGRNGPLLENVTQATYSQDGKDRLTRTTQVVGAVGGNDDIVTDHEYDPNTNFPLPQRVSVPRLSNPAQTPKWTRFTYDRYGQVVSATDPLDHTVSHDYDPATGNLRSVTAPDTAPTYYEYDPHGNVKKTRFGTAETTFGYNDYGRLNLTVSPTGVRREVEYDANGNRKREWTTWVNPDNPTQTRLLETVNTYDSNDRLTQSRDPEGQLTTYTYDALDRVKRTVTPTSDSETKYDARGLVVERRSPVRPGAAQYRLVRTVYDDQGRPTYVTDEYLENTSPTGARTTYDGAGRVTKVERVRGYAVDIETVAADVYRSALRPLVYTGAAASSGERTLTDATNPNWPTDQWKGQFVEILTGPGAGQVRVIESNTGQVLTAEQPWDQPPPGNGSTYRIKERVLSVNTTAYNDLGQVSETRDAAGLLTRPTYNPRGQSTQVDTVLSNPPRTYVIRTDYDDAGRATRSIDALDKATDTEYDGAGRPKKMLYAAPVGQPRPFTLTHYDDFGRKVAQTNELNRTTNFEYDAYGRLTAVVQPEVDNPEGPPARKPPRTEYFYDIYGSLRAQTDAKGRDTTFRYDAYQRQVMRSLPDLKATGAAVADPNASLLRAGGSPNWPVNQWQSGLVRLVAGKGAGQIRAVVSSTADTLTIAGTWDAGQAPDGTSQYVVSKGPSETSEYNPLGQLSRKFDFKGQKTEFVYDGFGRAEYKKLFATGVPTPAEQMQYHYDDLGRQDWTSQQSWVSGAWQEQVKTEQVFDVENRVTQVTTRQREGASLVSTALNYGYDPGTGRRTSTWTPSSRWVSVYDTLGRLEKVRVEQRNGQAVAEETVYAYTPVSTLSTVTRPTGVTTTYGYDDRHRVTAVTHAKAGVTTLPRYEYTHRADGKISQVKEFTHTTLQRTLDYVYDELGRLTRECTDAAGGNCLGAATNFTVYTLDLVGNRLTKERRSAQPTETTTWRYDVRDRVIDEVFSNGGPVRTTLYGWDSNGALLHKTVTVGSDEDVFTYDLEGRLSTATVRRPGPTVTTKTYRYNDHSLRIREEVTGPGAGITQFVVDASNPTGYAQVVEERGTDGTLRASFDYGLEPLSQWQASPSPTVSHYLMDVHSGVRALTDGTGVVTDTFRYDAFGVLVERTGATVNVVQYRGERFDAVVGQYYLRARTYDPVSGRFTRQDPFAGSSGDPLSFHKYVYAHADPTNNGDPSGNFTSFQVSIGVFSAFVMGVAVSIGTHTKQRAFEAFIPGWAAGRLFGEAIAHKEYGSALFALGLLTVDLVSLGRATSSFRESLGVGTKALSSRGIVGGLEGSHSVSRGIIRFLDEPVVSVTEGCLDCTIRSVENMHNLLGRSVNTSGSGYTSLLSRVRSGVGAHMSDLLELIVENATTSGKPYRRMSFASAARQGKPFITAIATEEPGHFHSIVIEKIYQEGGQKVAQVIDSEHRLKYIIEYSWLEHQAEVYEATLGGRASVLVK